MLEVGEHQSGFRKLADLLWAGGDVLEDSPPADQQREAAFAGGAQRPQQHVVGAVVDIETAAVGRLV